MRQRVEYCSILAMLLLHLVAGPDDGAVRAAYRTAGVPQLHVQDLTPNMPVACSDVAA